MTLTILSSLLIMMIPARSFAAETGYVELNQGWTAADVKVAHRANLGAEIIPEKWFWALEDFSSNKKFSDDLSRFGLP